MDQFVLVALSVSVGGLGLGLGLGVGLGLRLREGVLVVDNGTTGQKADTRGCV